MAEQTREEVLADFKKWLEEHREQWKAHILGALPMEEEVAESEEDVEQCT